MPPEDSAPGVQGPDDTQRPDIRNEIERLRADARERELKAEQEGVTAVETRSGLPEAGSRQEPGNTGEPAHVPASDEQARRRSLAAEIAEEREELVSDQEYVARARRVRDEAVARFGLDPDQADAEYLADLEGESYPDRVEAWMEASDPDRERAIAPVGADDTAQGDDDELYKELTHALAAVAERSAADARPRAQADSFADIWGAFTKLRESLGLPQGTDGTGTAAEHQAQQVPPGPVSAAPLEDAMTEARASAAWYRDSPEWQRITLVTDAARALLDAIRGAAGSYWEEISRDIRVRGFVRTVAARTCRTVSACAGALAARLEQAGYRQTAAWRAMSLLHRTAGAAANHIVGYRPPVADAEQIIAGLSRQRPAAGRPPQVSSPTALAALSFPGPVSQVTTTVPATARRDSATRTRRRLGGLRH